MDSTRVAATASEFSVRDLVWRVRDFELVRGGSDQRRDRGEARAPGIAATVRRPCSKEERVVVAPRCPWSIRHVGLMSLRGVGFLLAGATAEMNQAISVRSDSLCALLRR